MVQMMQFLHMQGDPFHFLSKFIICRFKGWGSTFSFKYKKLEGSHNVTVKI